MTAAAVARLNALLPSLGANQPVAFITAPDPRADSCLAWRPGVHRIQGISADGSRNGRMAGNHVLFLPEQDRNGAQILEDGFVVRLTRDDWSAFRHALATDASSWTAPDADNMRFRFRRSPVGPDEALPEEVFHNPVDGKTYVAPGGWHQYAPATPSNDQVGRPAQTQHIRLLTEQHQIAERTTMDALAAFIRVTEQLANQKLAASETAFRLLIQFACRPSGHDVQLATEGGASRDVLQGLFEALSEMERLPVSDGEVSFQIEMRVTPGAASAPSDRSR